MLLSHFLGQQHIELVIRTVTYPTRIHENNETNDKFYRTVALLMYTRKWLILRLKAEKQLRN